MLVPLALLLSAPAFARPHSGPHAVGFQHRSTPDGTEVGIWYPTGATPSPQPLELFIQTVAIDAPVVGKRLPLIVMSHGNGGSYAGHYDTALALAQAGFVVAALTHPGDNWHDESRAADLAARPLALSALVTFMLEHWKSAAMIDPRKVGAFGFSSGGFTVLAAAGGVPDAASITQHCVDHPQFFDCTLIATHKGGITSLPVAGHRDARLRALVVAAPRIGFAFGRAGLATVRVPVQVWRGGVDRILPAPFYADAVRADLPRSPDFRTEPFAGHFDFLAPCSAALAKAVPAICTSAPGFDRAKFHASFNAAVFAFFRRTLHVR